VGSVVASTALAALLLFGVAGASADDTSPAVARKVIRSAPENTNAPTGSPKGRVYNTDEVGMIIGGASKDAKAKVGRLPVRD
jgi:hypothetical protein